MATYQKQWEMTVAARGQSYPRWRAVTHKRKHHKREIMSETDMRGKGKLLPK